jgi:hypothetical protein
LSLALTTGAPCGTIAALAIAARAQLERTVLGLNE